MRPVPLWLISQVGNYGQHVGKSAWLSAPFPSVMEKHVPWWFCRLSEKLLQSFTAPQTALQICPSVLSLRLCFALSHDVKRIRKDFRWAVPLRVSQASEGFGRFDKTELCPSHSEFQMQKLQGLGICISHKHPSDAAAAGGPDHTV